MRNSFLLLLVLLASMVSFAQESPYFVTYDHHMEEPGNLEIEVSATTDVPRTGQKYYFAPWTEFEYGVTARWTAEVYIEGQTTYGTVRFSPAGGLKTAFVQLSGNTGSIPCSISNTRISTKPAAFRRKLWVGDRISRHQTRTCERPAHELETKLILSSDFHDWNVAGNFIVEKNLSKGEGFEFGYAAGFYHQLATLASGAKCRFCRENFLAGMEFYGGLGSTLNFSGRNTGNYVAPVISWLVSDNATLRFSPGFGLTHESSPLLFRFGYSYEIQGIGGTLSKLFRSNR